MEAKQFGQEVCKVLKDHKAENTVLIDVRGKTDATDFFVVSSGRSMTHTRSLTEHVEEEMEKLGVSPIRAEGIREGRWAVLDYGDVIVHVFNDETRLFYHLEKLWDDGENITKF